MTKKIFISLPVTDLTASVAFYTALGFAKNPQFSDTSAACMVWSETISVMLLTHAKWRTFTTRPIPPSTSSEVALNLSCDSREAVDAMNAAAAATWQTPMAISGARCGWTWPPCRRKRRSSSTLHFL